MKKLISLLVLGLIFISTSQAQSFAIGPQVGYVKAADENKSSIMPGIAARLKFIGFNIEGSISYKKEEYLNGSMKTTSYPIMLTAMINIIPIVHGEVGVGWYNSKIEYSDILASYASETKTDMGYHVGAGVELPLGNLLLTGDIRYVFLNLKPNNYTNLSEIKSNYSIILVGAMFRL
jgi:hypothetical protein